MVCSASEYLFLPCQESFLEEAFLQCYSMKHEEELCIRDKMHVTRSEKTDRLGMSEATPSCLGDNIDQCTLYTLGHDAREMKGTREEKNLKESKDGVQLMNTVMAENSVMEVVGIPTGRISAGVPKMNINTTSHLV